jgi:hypothetical protein
VSEPLVIVGDGMAAVRLVGMARPFNRGFGLALKAQSCSSPRREGHADASLTLASSSRPPASSRRTLTSAFSAKRSRAADDEVVMRLQLSKQLLLIDTDARRRWFSGRTRRSWSARPDPESQVRIRLPAGGRLIRTSGSGRDEIGIPLDPLSFLGPQPRLKLQKRAADFFRRRAYLRAAGVIRRLRDAKPQRHRLRRCNTVARSRSPRSGYRCWQDQRQCIR